MSISGMINPAKLAPGKLQALTITSGTRTVNRYITSTFIDQDRSPKVRMFIGINRILRSGFTKRTSSERIRPENMVICQLPLIAKPG